MSKAINSATTQTHLPKSRQVIPAQLDCRIIPMDGAIRVTFFQPLAPDLTRTIKGALVAQVHTRGKLLWMPE